MTKIFAGLLAVCTLQLVAASAVAGPYRYTGKAQALFAKGPDGPILGLGIAQLPGHYSDGEDTDRSATLQTTALLNLSGFYAHTESVEGKVRSTAKVLGLRILPNDLPIIPDLISADSIRSVTTDTANGKPHGFAEFVNFKINGEAFTPSGEPNQAIGLNVALVGKVKLIFNVQRMFDDGHMNNVALRIVLPTGVNIEIARSIAGSVPKNITP
jgi:hypothetical protein